MHPLQYDRKILLAAAEEMLALAEFYLKKCKDEPQNHEMFYELANAFALEAARLGPRLWAVQHKIEELDLD